MPSVPKKPTPAEARADAILAEIPEAEMDEVARVLANLLISARRSDRRWRTLGRPAAEGER